MRAILFGLGNFFKNRQHEIRKNRSFEIVAFSDNNSQLWNQDIDGIPVIPPDRILELQFDAVIITSTYVVIIRQQLLNLGIKRSQIIFWEDYRSELVSGILQIHYANYQVDKNGKKALIISTRLNYGGGSLAAIYAGQALQQKGYNVVLAVPDGDEKFIQEWVNNGITIAVCPALPYIKDRELEWIWQFDIVLVNVLRMMPCVSIIARYKPVVWWIHESVGNYSLLSDEYSDLSVRDKLSQVQICTVSTIPQRLFNSYLENRIDAILHYGIPDKRKVQIHTKNSDKIVFAIIGGVCSIKGHDIFIEAVKKISPIKKDNVEFWIVGKNDIDKFSQKIVEQASAEPAIRLLGEKTREEIELLYLDIDVVVSVSRIDSLPIVMTEGMMYGKICIASDTTGTMDYIEDGINGFIVEHENSDDLSRKMEWIIDNPEQLDKVRKRARETYENYFTMEQFGIQLEKMFGEAERKQRNKIV